MVTNNYYHIILITSMIIIICEVIPVQFFPYAKKSQSEMY